MQNSYAEKQEPAEKQEIEKEIEVAAQEEQKVQIPPILGMGM